MGGVWLSRLAQCDCDWKLTGLYRLLGIEWLPQGSVATLNRSKYRLAMLKNAKERAEINNNNVLKTWHVTHKVGSNAVLEAESQAVRDSASLAQLLQVTSAVLRLLLFLALAVHSFAFYRG